MIDWLREVRGLPDDSWIQEQRDTWVAKTNPIRKEKDRGANLELSFFGFTEADLDKDFMQEPWLDSEPPRYEIFWSILNTLCQSCWYWIQVYQRTRPGWLSYQRNGKQFNVPLPLEKKKAHFGKAEPGSNVQKFLHTKYIGQKRFSLEGGETTIAALDAIINTAADHSVQEVVIGMAHRGAG